MYKYDSILRAVICNKNSWYFICLNANIFLGGWGGGGGDGDSHLICKQINLKESLMKKWKTLMFLEFLIFQIMEALKNVFQYNVIHIMNKNSSLALEKISAADMLKLN